MEYTISFKVDGRLSVKVQADNIQEAFEKGKVAFEDADLKDMEFIDAEPVNCTDEDGNLTDYE